MQQSYLSVKPLAIPVGHLLHGNRVFQYRMNKYEQRRLALIALRKRMEPGAVGKIANAIGKDATYISRMLAPPDREGRKRITEDFVDLLNAAFPDWMTHHAPPAETGVMPDEIKEPSVLAGDYAALTPELIPPRKVPVEGTAQLGDDGYWSRLEGNTDGCVLAWSRDENAYALRCKGDSMQPRIQDGEFVVIEPNTEPRPGDEVLIQHTDGRVMVKRFLYERDGRYHVMSINQAHPPQSFARETIDRFYPVVAIVKKVFWVPE